MKKPANYYCHKQTAEEKEIETPFEVIEKIGEGTFGEVYKVFDPSNSRLMVLKKEKKHSRTKTGLQKESTIMMEMSASEGFASVNKVENTKGNEYVVMSILGCSFGSIHESHRKISVYSMKRIAFQLVTRLK